MISNKKILVISNNSFSKTNSNGRTLGNFLIGWPKDSLAQFCISTTEPDFEVCQNYFCIPDMNVFDAFKHFRKAKRSPILDCMNTAANTRILTSRPSIKTATKALIRHVVWKNRWDSEEFRNWVDEFKADVVLVMNSDSAFLLEIARKISERKAIPLVMYNTEGFYFFEQDYMKEISFIDKASFCLYKRIYRNAFRKLMQKTSLSMHLNGKLCKDFKEEFGGKHEVLYSSSSMKNKEYVCDYNNPIFNYLGNFGFDRASALLDIADVLRDINPEFKLHVYGRIPTDEITNRFKACSNILLEGFVTYEQVKHLMYHSTILFHAESQDAKYEESLRYGFTTKIADSLSCGVPFLMYSRPSVAGADYIIETKAGWYASNKRELKECIIQVLYNSERRSIVLERAKEIAFLNHNEKRLRVKFVQLIQDLCNGKK